MGPVLASWRLNLLRGSAAQWWEVDRTHGDTPTPLAPGPFPPTRTCRLAGPDGGLTALLSPIHMTLWRRKREVTGEIQRERRW